MSTSTPHITCLCGAINLPLPPATTLPVHSEICHCNTCRHTSGALTAVLSPLSSAPPPDTLSHCTAYSSSAKNTRYFCRTCGNKTFLKGHTDDGVQWFVCGGSIEPTGPDEVNRVETQVFVDDTLDGGLAGRMVTVAREKGWSDADVQKSGLLGKVYPGYWAGAVLTPQELDALAERRALQREKAQGSGKATEKLSGRCHCGAVEFCVRRPQTTKLVGEHVKWALRDGGTKCFAQLCACRSCRLGSGNPLQPWMYTPSDLITTTTGGVIDFNGEGDMTALAGLKSYRSSKGVRRTFCGTCGASVFFELDTRPNVVDLCMGILRSEVGALVQDWCEWDWDVGFKEECADKELLESLLATKRT